MASLGGDGGGGGGRGGRGAATEEDDDVPRPRRFAAISSSSFTLLSISAGDGPPGGVFGKGAEDGDIADAAAKRTLAVARAVTAVG